MFNIRPMHILICCLLACLLTPVTRVTAQPHDDVLVLVNDIPISRRDLAVEMTLLNAEMQYRNRSLSKHQKARLSRQLVDNLIARELLYQRAREMKLGIRKRWVDIAMADFKAELKTAAAYRAYLKDARMGEDQLKDRIRKGLIVRRLLRRDVIRQVKVSEAEMQAFYRKHPEFFQRREQIRVRHILIAVDPPYDEAKRAKAMRRIKKIQHKMLQGKSFAALALEYSKDNSRANGGDLGYLERNQLIPSFADAAFALKPGQVSNIVETRLGYHLIQLVDRRPSSKLAYRNVRTKIERTLRRNKEKRATDAYLAKLKRNASIKRLAQQ